MSCRMSPVWSDAKQRMAIPTSKGTVTRFTPMKQQFPQGECLSTEERTHFVLTPSSKSWTDDLPGRPACSILQRPGLHGGDG